MNQTKTEAADRIFKAMRNSLAGDPSIQYLYALKNGLNEWIKYIEWLIRDKERGITNDRIGLEDYGSTPSVWKE